MSCGVVPFASVLCELMTPDPCYTKAIDMQKCLRANRNREGVCFGAMSVMEKCCNTWKGSSECCVLYERTRPPNPVKPKLDLTDHFMMPEFLLGH